MGNKSHMKGQIISLSNMVGVVVGFILFFFLFMPIYQPMANLAIAQLDPAWQFYAITIVMIYLIPLVVIVALALGVVNIFQPQYG